MSVVTGIVVVCRVGDEDVLRGLSDALVKRGWPALQIDDGDGFCGNKHPQLCIGGSGVNYFSSGREEFVQDFLTAPWGQPWAAVLIMQPEDGATEVLRPAWRAEDVY